MMFLVKWTDQEKILSYLLAEGIISVDVHQKIQYLSPLSRAQNKTSVLSTQTKTVRKRNLDSCLARLIGNIV